MASLEGKRRARREKQHWRKSLTLPAMRKSTMPTQPWSTDPKPPTPVSAVSIMADELKCPASSKHSSTPHLLKRNFGLLKSGIKSCSQSVSFSELFNVFQERSAYLNSSSFNVLDADEIHLRVLFLSSKNKQTIKCLYHVANAHILIPAGTSTHIQTTIYRWHIP